MTTTQKVQLRDEANSVITYKEIDKSLACKVVIYIDDSVKTKDAKVILKHSTNDCKRLAFKQARSFLRKYNVTASLAKRSDLTLTHKVTTLKINDAKQKVNYFTYRVVVAEVANTANTADNVTE